MWRTSPIRQSPASEVVMIADLLMRILDRL
jgi:hypothetical protein